MRCLNRDIIQSYIDGEVTAKTVARIENHLATCGHCADEVNHHRKLAGRVKYALNLYAESSPEAIKGVMPTEQSKNRFLTTKKLICFAVAACILAFILVINRKKNTEFLPEITTMPGFATEIDANRPVSKQPLVIIIIDSEGNVTEYFN